MGKVVFPETGFNEDGCQPLSWADFPSMYSADTQAERLPNLSLFVLVDRGNCSNPTKVRNIENFGGAVALIADYQPESMDDFVMVDYGGAGHSLVTPGFMVDFFSANLIKEVLQAGGDVVMRAALTIARPDNEIEIGLLYSSTLDLDSQSMNSFTHLALESVKSRKKALLDLHIHTFGCPYCPDLI